MASSAGACARRFLVTDAARLVPAPHLRDENLIEGAGASILEQRNGRGTAEDIIVNNTMYLYPIVKK